MAPPALGGAFLCGVLWTTRARVEPLLHPAVQGGILTGAACMDPSRYWLLCVLRRSLLRVPHIRIRPDCGLCQSFPRFMGIAYADSSHSWLLRSSRRSPSVGDACADLCRSSVCILAAMASFCGCYVHGFVAKTPLFYIYELLVHHSRYQTPQQSRKCGGLIWENMEDGGRIKGRAALWTPDNGHFLHERVHNSKKMAFFAIGGCRVHKCKKVALSCIVLSDSELPKILAGR